MMGRCGGVLLDTQEGEERADGAGCCGKDGEQKMESLHNKTTKLDRINRSVSYPSQIKFCERTDLCLVVRFFQE